MPVGIGLVVLAVAVCLLVLSRLVKVRVRVKTSVRVNDLRAFSRDLDQRVTEYMRANYGGDPAQLDGAMRGLVSMARNLARERGERLEESTMRSLIVALVNARRFASRRQAEAALDAALSAERQAA
jgi:hypothetical protein